LDKKIIIALLKKHRETAAYLICGATTTLLGLAVYFGLYRFIGDIPANSVAFALSLLYAYLTNSKLVFRKAYSWVLFGQFFGMRIGTIVISDGGLWLLLRVGCPRLLAQIILNTVMIALNYVFSKFFIFKGDDTK
jgi:putative flippase GtrA